MPFDSQPILRGKRVTLKPLQMDDFDALYAAARDPLIWAQHPAKNRYRLEPFEQFFRDALDSGGALIVINTRDKQAIGSSRFHGYNEALSEVEIGWTFLARAYWGGHYNREMKHLMMRHAFTFVDNVVLLVGPDNIRSQRAIEALGGARVGMRPDGSGLESIVYRFARETLEKE